MRTTYGPNCWIAELMKSGCLPGVVPPVLWPETGTSKGDLFGTDKSSLRQALGDATGRSASEAVPQVTRIGILENSAAFAVPWQLFERSQVPAKWQGSAWLLLQTLLG